MSNPLHWDGLFRPATKVIDQTDLATRFARDARVASMQDQPVMGVALEFGWNDFFQSKLNFQRRFSRRQTGAISDAKQMGIDGDGRFTKGDVEHDIGRLAPHPGNFSSSSRERGTSPPWFAINCSDSAITFFALVR